jgi:predicted NUDIX family NTP pyrophosphohydrolase
VTEQDADLLACAQREFREETGFVARGEFVTLEAVRQRSGKTVHAFAFEADFDPAQFESVPFELEWPPKSGRRQKFPELDRIAYFPYEAALEKIIPYQRPFLVELNTMLHRG